MVRSDGLPGTPARRSAAAVAGLVVAVAALPFLLTSQRDLSLLSFVAIFSLVAYSVNISFRYSGVLMIAQGAVWGIGAYTGGLLHNAWGWSFWAVIPIAAAAGALSAVVIGAVSLRSRGHYFLVVTFAINEFIVLVANQVGFTGGRGGLLVLDRPEPLGPLTFDTPLRRYYLFAGFLMLTIAVFAALEHTALGRRLIAVRENEDLSRAVGVSILRSQLHVLALGGALAGVAGVLYLYHQRAIQPDLFSALLFLQVVLMVIIGGADTVTGVFFGALLMLVLPEKLGMSPIARQITYGTLLIGIILLAPKGVAGATRAWFVRRWPGSPDGPGPEPDDDRPVPGSESGYQEVPR